MRRLVLSLLACLLLAACSGGSGGGGNAAVPAAGGATTVGSAQPGLSSSHAIYSLSTGSHAYTLPSIGTAAGTMTLDAPSASPATQLVLTANLTPTPTAVLSTSRSQADASGAGVAPAVMFTLEVSVSSDTPISGLPAFALTSPDFRGGTASEFGFVLFDDTACTHAIARGGLAAIDGTTGTIAPGNLPMTLVAGKLYTFVFTKTVVAPDAANAVFVDAKRNAVISVDLAASAPTARVVGGSQTQLDGPQDVAAGPGGTAVVLNRLQAPFDPALYYQAQSSALVFAANAVGNVAPSTVLPANGDRYSHLAASTTGIVYLWGTAQGPGTHSAFDYLTGSATMRYTYTQLPSAGRYLNIEAAAIAADGTPAYAGVQDGVTQFYEALCVGTTCAKSAATLPIPASLTYADLAFDPKSGSIFALEAPGGATAVVDVYPATNAQLGKPSRSIAYTGRLASASSLRFGADGSLYLFGKTSGGDRAVAVSTPADVAAGQVTRVDDIEGALAGYDVGGFAVVQP